MSLQAQDAWSLQKCVQYALDNNISVKQAEANVQIALLAEKQAKSARLPNVNASSNVGKQFGRTIDPTTNSFVTSGIGYNSMSLNANVSLFSGGQKYHSVLQADWDAKASFADQGKTINNLSLQIASAYLNILLTEEQERSALKRVAQSNEQLKSTLKLIEAGSQPQAERYTIEAQIAREEQSAIVAHNNVEMAYLSLKQLLQLEPDFVLEIQKPEVRIPADVNPDLFDLKAIYEEAIGRQPSVVSAEFRIKSAEEGVKIAKAAYMPSISAFASLSSNFSTQYKDYVYTGNYKQRTTIVGIGGNDVPVVFYDPEVQVRSINYLNQMDRNFGQNVGISLNVPIYQNGRTHLSVERARLNILNAQLTSNQAKQTLKNDIQTAIANVRSAKRQMDAASKSVDANRIAFTNAEKRYALGANSALDFFTAKTNLAISENDLIVAKYDYLFRLKILDFYQGKTLAID
ncbi:MAG: TolC family protein [Bacteroidetes bacterium]|nr:TolC family protein [Bacteroidota bacterium]